MKVKETVTKNDLINAINNQVIGIFTTLISAKDEYSSLAPEMCTNYYLAHSGNKEISKIWEELIELTKGTDYPPDSVLGSIIRNRYKDKWTKIYRAFVTENYNPLDEYDRIETRVADNTETMTYNSQTEDDGSTGFKETTVNTTNTDDGLYGFNSRDSVPSDTSVENINNTRTRLPTDNTNHNIESKTGTDSKNDDIDETITKSGRDTSPSDLIEKELSLRDKETFFEIVFIDIDKIATKGVYC